MAIVDGSPIETATRRLNAAVEALDAALRRQHMAGRKLGTMESEIEALAEDRSRLARELEDTREKFARLEQLKGDVEDDIDGAIAAIEDFLDLADQQA